MYSFQSGDAQGDSVWTGTKKKPQPAFWDVRLAEIRVPSQKPDPELTHTFSPIWCSQIEAGVERTTNALSVEVL